MPAQTVRSVRFGHEWQQLEDRAVPAVTVRLDYSYDSAGFFNDPNRRAIVQRAADLIGSKLQDNLSPILPGGLNSWQANVFNPATKSSITLNNLVVNGDEIIVFINSASLGAGNELGLTTTGGFTANGTRSWLDTVRSRGQMGVMSNPKTDFSTWGGMITFDSRVNWSFDGTPSSTEYDFESVALHEMMHIFGFGLGEPAFTRNVQNGVFVGPTVMYVNGGKGVPVVGNPPDHWAPGTSYNGQPSPLQPSLAPGERRQLSTLDYAALNDLGWEIYSVPGVSPSLPMTPVTPSAESIASTGSSAVLAGQVVPASTAPIPRVAGRMAVGTSNAVIVYGPTGQTLLTAQPFGAAYTAGVRVASADINGDGVLDVVAGTGPGVQNAVRIIDGRTAAQIATITPFEASFTGGVNVTTADFTGDGRADVVVSADQSGGPVVVIYDGAALASGRVVQVNRFLAINDPNFRGGVRVAAGDINGDRVPDLVVAAGFGGGPRLATYDGRTIRNAAPTPLFNDFFAFESTLRNGTFVAVMDLDNDGRGDIVVGAGPGGAPRVTAFSGLNLLSNQQQPIANFFAGGTDSRGGVRVAISDLDDNGSPDLLTGSGTGQTQVRTYQRGELVKATPAASLTLPTPGDVNTGVFVG